WQSGQGPAADDDGHIYLMAGNGTFDEAGNNYGDSFVKLDPHAVISGVLPVVDSFTPYDQAQLAVLDHDLGSVGPVMITGTRLLLGGAKSGKLYLLDADDLGGYQEGPDDGDRVVQSIQATLPHTIPLFGAPIVWYSPSGPKLYMWPSN